MSIDSERSYSTPVANSSLLPLLLLSLARQRHTPEPTRTFKYEYDYIIVGAGAAGSVMASRLSEYPCVRVLLLEAGPKPPLLTEVPSLGRHFWNSDVDWKYISVPQRYSAAGMIDRKFPWACGKMIGGSSTLNSMQYVRGNMKIYDDWEDFGAKGWSYNDVYPYFLKLEDNRTPEFLSNGYHAFGGPITVEQVRYNHRLKGAVLEAATSLGYEILDSNAGRQTGFYDEQANLRDNQRCSTAKAYLVPAENRTNLDIVANAFVTRVLIEGDQATGVQFDFEGVTYRIKAKREVILSAGAMNTPQLLKLSGVGPRKELEKFNIPVVADLAVGYNLQNHGGVFYPFTLNNFEPDFNEKIADPWNIQEYIYNRSGPLSSNDGFMLMAFLRGQDVFPIEDIPNFQLYITELPLPMIKGSGLTGKVYDKCFRKYEGQAIFTCSISALQQRSRGTITLQSADPYDPPLIDPNFLADIRDVEDLVDGLKACKRLLATPPLKEIGATPLNVMVPGCESFFGDEDEYLRCYVRTLMYAYHHPAGTARMGMPSDPRAVVDPKLKVMNIRSLRVVDASVMPIVTSGNTHIPTIMIAERASDMIKQTIKCFARQ